MGPGRLVAVRHAAALVIVLVAGGAVLWVWLRIHPPGPATETIGEDRAWVVSTVGYGAPGARASGSVGRQARQARRCGAGRRDR